mgnify:CR=1 FL=1
MIVDFWIWIRQHNVRNRRALQLVLQHVHTYVCVCEKPTSRHVCVRVRVRAEVRTAWY